MALSIDQQVAQLQVIRDGYLAALAADAADPQPNHIFEGQVVDTDGWREKTMARLEQINRLIALYAPFEITTVQN